MNKPLISIITAVLLLFSASGLAQWTQLENVGVDYTPRPTFDRVNKQLVSVVTITNTGDSDLNTPLRLMFDATNHAIINATGADENTPFIDIAGIALAPGDSHSLPVKMNISRERVSFDLRLLTETSTATGLDLAANQIAVFYSRDDENYENWGLHLWNGEGCGNYAAPTATSTYFNNWTDPYPADGIHPDYGAYYILNIEPGASCYNFIVHKGDDKALGNANSRFDPSQGQEGFTFHGYPEIWYSPLTSRPASIDGARAHWIDTDTLLWRVDSDAAESYSLYYSTDASLSLDDGNFNGTQYLPMQLANVDAAIRAQLPHMDNFTGFTLNTDVSRAKMLVKQQLMAVARDSEGEIVDITRVQIPRLLDHLYTSGNNDADEANLGITYTDSQITAAIWAPTATAVKLNVFNDNKQPVEQFAMDYDENSGIWRYQGDAAALDRLFYQYEIDVYHPLTESMEVVHTSDPYSVSLSTNGQFSQFVNLDDTYAADLAPQGWNSRMRPALPAPEEAVIYETHIRDFSIRDESVTPEYRGKYMAFTEENSTPVNHLASLAEAGMTHIHLLPANDIASINEDESSRVDLTDTVGRLCATVPDAPVCGVESNSAVLWDVLEGYDPASTDAQALIDSMRRLDGFNWGYDPHHFAAPEGSYATDPDGEARIKEMRAMVMALNNMGLQVILDVVYNHTASSGLYDTSVLDKAVPGYYQRLNEVTGAIENSTCCENTATEHRMMAKLMNDSLVSFAKHFGFDGFRFDLMGHIPKQAVLDAREAVREVDADTLFYGEGWNFGEVVNDRRFPQASQYGMAGTEVGTFNDRLREAVRSAELFKNNGSTNQQDLIRLSMAGSLSGYEFVTAGGEMVKGEDYDWNGQSAAYAEDPADSVHYVSKHDNETLWDQLQYNLPSAMPLDDRVRVQSIALSIPLLSQGIPFLHMGSELLRSKSMDRNTYDAGDWFNLVDFTATNNAWNTGLPLAQDNQNRWPEIRGISANPNSAIDAQAMHAASEQFKDFLRVRKSSPLFKLRTLEDIRRRVTFHNTGTAQTQGLIVMSIDDGHGVTDIDPAHDAVLVVINATDSTQTVTGFGDLMLHPVQQTASDPALTEITITTEGVSVPRLTTAVLVKPQSGSQGSGISALPPYGDQPIYLRGDMNGWATSDPFTYQGNKTYSLTTTLAAGDYTFKIADEAFGQANIGGGFNVPVGGEATLQNGGNNLTLSIPQTAEYQFELTAQDVQAPILTITSDAITPPEDTGPYNVPIFVRGTMNNWSATETFELSYKGNGMYKGSVALDAGSHTFKIADANWSSVNIGANGPGQTVQTDTPWDVINSGDSQDLSFIAPVSSAYIVSLDASNPASPILTIAEDVPPIAETLYLRGTMNSWGTAHPMQYVGMGIYTADVAQTAGTTYFKVATQSWSINFGASNQNTLGYWFPMYENGGDSAIDIDVAETYRYWFDATAVPAQMKVEPIVE
ncbi:pullulanase-type alpha-1,6-glucosidase [Salinimonas chungwhensis]|uniref:pullulanase-type alpha-1,6-glucosidase n=1 Tax=Salinimonas chungwhensis TaxID=265425 RepID=UPI000382233B|nr:pullulanase-type alpha-1,6-glucosidase [Salinimonas chungwhensis]